MFIRRPWYIAAATQRSKDAVVLVDVSNNVNKELFKELMLAFLRTLDPRDKVWNCTLTSLIAGTRGGARFCPTGG